MKNSANDVLQFHQLLEGKLVPRAWRCVESRGTRGTTQNLGRVDDDVFATPTTASSTDSRIDADALLRGLRLMDMLATNSAIDIKRRSTAKTIPLQENRERGDFRERKLYYYHYYMVSSRYHSFVVYSPGLTAECEP